MNLVAKLRDQSEADPGRLALVDRQGRTATYGELLDRVRGVASALGRVGLGPGDRVLVFHPVSIELYAFLLGCFHAGVVAVLADPSGGRGFLGGVCRRSRPRAFFGSRRAQWLRWTVPEMRRIGLSLHPASWCPGSRVLEAGDGAAAMHPATEGHPALITFTSGSTGEPKGAVRTHGFLLAQHAALSGALALEAGQRDLVTLPVFALANLASGVTSVLADADLGRPGEVEPARIRSQCRHWGVSRATAAPAFFEAMLGGGGLPQWERVFTGGAPVFPDLVERLKAARPQMEVTAVYGSTEAEPVAELAAGEWTESVRRTIAGGGGLPAGRPVLDVAILPDRFGRPLGPFTGDEFRARVLGPGERGEIVVAGPQVLDGYLDGRGDEETKIRVDGRVWHRTGDAGWLDDEGRLWLAGRCAARLGTRYPLEIEAALRLRFPDRRGAALALGEEVVLVVEGGATPELDAAARELGCGRVIGIDRLPVDRRHQSKIDYPRLRRKIGG